MKPWISVIRRLLQFLGLGLKLAYERRAGHRNPLDFRLPPGTNARAHREASAMTILPNSLEARDVAYYFHPATNARRHEKVGPLVMESGHGVYVCDDQGKEYIEG